MKKWHVILLFLFSGLLLSSAWIIGLSSVFLFIALVPILIGEYYSTMVFKKTTSSVLLYTYCSFIIWNILTTAWLRNASMGGAIFAVISNSFLSALFFTLFHATRTKFGNLVGYSSLIFYWIGWEYFYLNAEISWPWLILGYGFSDSTEWIQWYEYTGSLGGSLWVIVLNLILFFAIKSILIEKNKNMSILWGVIFILGVLIPISISKVMYNSYTEKYNPIDVVVIQPNIDPYNEKFSGMSRDEQLEKILTIANEKADSSVDYFVAPETALENNIWLHYINENEHIIRIRDFVRNYPNSRFVIGMDCYKVYNDLDSLTYTARQINDTVYYDAFNSSIQIDSSLNYQIYHKSKLVVGVEMLPYPQYLKFINVLSVDLGGVIGGRATQKERNVYVNTIDTAKVGPVICYESVFGEFVTEYVKKGANVLFILTNDGWWGNTDGHLQHLNFARLRAIETRRSIARSANTGVSAFINQRGDILMQINWWIPGSIRHKINLNDSTTFYVKHGDYIGRMALSGLYVLAIIMLLKMFFPKILNYKK